MKLPTRLDAQVLATGCSQNAHRTDSWDPIPRGCHSCHGLNISKTAIRGQRSEYQDIYLIFSIVLTPGALCRKKCTRIHSVEAVPATTRS